MNKLEEFRLMKDEFFRTDPQSPLTDGQKEIFDGLNYFPDNSQLELDVEINPFSEQETIQIQTNTGDIQKYARYGRFRFMVEGQEVELTLYESEHGYFLPFVDSLAGNETYGAGRYLEPEPLGGNRFRVDFNLAYNPYCAYNPHWSCPITPAENRLKVPIRAGEKVFEGYE